jgi:O-antigen/teichoic acid export membrane protein
VSVQVDRHVSRLFGRDSLYMLLWAIQLLCAAALTPVITRLLGTGEFGVVASGNAIMQVLFVIAGFGLATAVQRQYERPGGRVDAARILTAAILLAALVTGLALATTGLWGGSLGLAGETSALRLAVVWAGSSAVTAVSLALLRSQDRLTGFALVSLMQSVVAEAASLVLIAGDRAGADDFLLGQVLAQVAALVLALLLAPPRPARLRDLPMIRSALRFSVPFVPAVLGTFVLSVADRLVVQAELGNVEVARYQVAYNVASVPMLLLSVLYSTWMPRFFALPEPTERAAVIAASRDVLYRLLVPLTVGFAIGAPLVLRWWAPPSYRLDSLNWVVLLVVVTAVPFAGQLASIQALTAAGRTADIAIATLVAAGANLALNFLLVPHLGLSGPALATLAAYALLAAIMSGRSRRLAPVPAASRMLRVRLGVAMLAAGAAAAAPTMPGVRAGLALVTAGWFVAILASLRHAKGTPSLQTEM